jgi:hypothetical protein
VRREAVALANAADAMLVLGRTVEAEEALGRAMEGSRRVGNERTIAVTTANLGLVRRLRGDLPGADVHTEAAREAAARIGHARLAVAVASERVYAALAGGLPAPSLRSRAQDALAAADKSGSPGLSVVARAVAMRALHRAGDDVQGMVTQLRGGHWAEWPAVVRVEVAAALADVEGTAEDHAAVQHALDEIVGDAPDGRGVWTKRVLAS